MPSKTCIIGAGVSGLCAVKALQEEGLPFDCFDLASDLGGLWRYRSDSGRSAAYRGLHINTSKKMMEFWDAPMPEDYPHYPSHWQVWQYFSDYADRHGLRERITFRHEVTRVEPVDGGAGGYDVTVHGLDTGQTSTARYGAVIVANGHHWSPRRPTFPGTFEGTQMHSFDYDEPEPFRGQRVLVVGIGNSGVDVATEVSFTAERTFLSTRRGAWILPRFVFGRPTDHLDTPLGARLPLALRRAAYRAILNVAVGDQADYGIPRPRHQLLSEHPTMSSLLLERCAHGKVTMKPNVAELRGRRVRFEDGSEEDIDTIIYATGYNVEFPFFDPAFLRVEDNRVPLYRRIVHPDIPNLYFIGLFQVLGAMMPIAQLQAQWIAGLISGRLQLPDRATMHRVMAREERAVAARFTASPRHTMQVDYWPYIFTLRKALTNRLDKPRRVGGRATPFVGGDGRAGGRTASTVALAGAALAGGLAAGSLAAAALARRG